MGIIRTVIIMYLHISYYSKPIKSLPDYARSLVAIQMTLLTFCTVDGEII